MDALAPFTLNAYDPDGLDALLFGGCPSGHARATS
jgi:hypothetical protein